MDQCFDKTMVLDKHQAALSVLLRGYIATYLLGTRLEGKSVYESSCIAAKLVWTHTGRLLSKMAHNYIRADYHVRFRKGWSQEVEITAFPRRE